MKRCRCRIGWTKSGDHKYCGKPAPKLLQGEPYCVECIERTADWLKGKMHVDKSSQAILIKEWNDERKEKQRRIRACRRALA